MRLHHRLDGDEAKPVVVLAGSLGTTLELWDCEVEPLLRRFRVLRFDHRGHGGSEVPPGPYAVADLAGDVLELLGRLGLGRVTVCGLSLGGAVAMWLARFAPERVERLVLCSTSARFGPPEQWLERARLVRAEGVAAVAEAVLGRWFTAPFAAAHPEVVDRFRRMLVASPREGYAACCEAVAAWDFRDELGAIAAPTLVLVGEEDSSTPPDHAELIARGIAGAELVVLPKTAHLVDVERPEAFVDAVCSHAGVGAA